MNNAVFGKNIENVEKNRYVKPITTERRKNCLVPDPNYYTKKFFTENSLEGEMKTNRNTYE